jgi:hypothetical protein
MGEAVVHIEAISAANCHQVSCHERLGFVHTFPIDAFAFCDRFGECVRRQESDGGLPIPFLRDGQLPIGNESRPDPICVLACIASNSRVTTASASLARSIFSSGRNRCLTLNDSGHGLAIAFVGVSV